MLPEMHKKAIERIEETIEFLEQVEAAIQKTKPTDRTFEEIAEKLKINIEETLEFPTPLAESLEGAELEAKTKNLTRSTKLMNKIESHIGEILG